MTMFDLKQFIDKGILQEANRSFFHPLGLAISVDIDDDGAVSLGHIVDSDDAEGWMFGEIDSDKAAAFKEWASGRAPDRLKALGWLIQPI